MPEAAPTRPGATLRALLLDPRTHAWLLALGAALVMLSRSGASPLANYDDAYYAEKAKQMLRTGDWLSPHFNGVLRLDNPPLFLWLIAGSFRWFGITAWAAILPSALAGIGAVVAVHRLARELGRDAFEAWAAGLVLLGTGYFLKYANHAMFDVFLALLLVCALLAYRRAWEGSARAWLALGLLTGLGVLTKSVLGLFPLIIAGVHLLATRRVTRALSSGAWLAPLAAAVVVAPWYGAQLALHREQFMSEHIAWLLFDRGLGRGIGATAPSQPLGYLREIALTYWPWLPLALAGLVLAARKALGGGLSLGPRHWGERESAWLLLLWPLVIVGVLSAGHEKKLWYAMGAFPALALLAAHALTAWARDTRVRERLVLGGFALVFAAGAVLALTPLGAAPPRRPDLQDMARAARALVPEHGPVVAFEREFWSIAHQFVFYSDRTLVPGDGTEATARRALDAGEWVLLSRKEYARVAGADSLRYVRVVSSGKWALVHLAPRPEVSLGPEASAW